MATQDFLFRLEPSGAGDAEDIGSNSEIWNVMGAFLPTGPNPSRPVACGAINAWLPLPTPGPTNYEPVLQLWGGWSQPTQIATEWNLAIESVDLTELCGQPATDNPERPVPGELPHRFSRLVTIQTPLGAAFQARLVVAMQASLLSWIKSTKVRPIVEAPRALITTVDEMPTRLFPTRYKSYLVPAVKIDGMNMPFRYLLMGRPGEPLDWSLALHWLRIAGAVNPDCHAEYVSPGINIYLEQMVDPVGYTSVCRAGWRVAETWYDEGGIIAVAHAGRLLAALISCPFLQSIYALDETLERAEAGAVKVSLCESMYTPLPNLSSATQSLVGDCEEAAVCNQHVFLALRDAFRRLADAEPAFDPNNFGASHSLLAKRLEAYLPSTSTAAERAMLISLAFLAMQYTCLSAIVTTNDESISDTKEADLTRISAGLHATTILLPLAKAITVFGLAGADYETTPITAEPFVDDRMHPDIAPSAQPLRHICIAMNPRLRGLLVESTNQINPLIDGPEIVETVGVGVGHHYTKLFRSMMHSPKLRDRGLQFIRETTGKSQATLLDDRTKLIGVPCMLRYNEFYGIVLQACLLGRTDFLLGQHTVADLLQPIPETDLLTAVARILAPTDVPLARGITVIGRLRDDTVPFVADRARRRIPFPLLHRSTTLEVPRVPADELSTLTMTITAAAVGAHTVGAVDLDGAVALLRQAKCTVVTTELSAYTVMGLAPGPTSYLLTITLPRQARV